METEYRVIRRPGIGEIVTRGKQYMGSGHWAGGSRKCRIIAPIGSDDFKVSYDIAGDHDDWDEIVHIQSLVGCHTFARE